MSTARGPEEWEGMKRPADNDTLTRGESAPIAWFSRLMRGPGPVLLLTLALLLPFINKAYHIDDPVFIRMAEQIQSDPLHPYRVQYNLDGTLKPAWHITQHPPLNCYVIAVVTAVTGLTEWPLHLAFLGIAVGCAALMYSIASRYCQHPGLAASATVVTPAFVISATNIMADVPLLFTWLLAIWFAVRFVETRLVRWIWLAGIAASAAAMTKYFGVALVPLLLVYCWPASRRKRMNLAALMLPVAVLILWGLYAQKEGGGFHPTASASFSLALKEMIGDSPWRIVGHTTSFLGGGMIWPIALAPLLVVASRRPVVAVLRLLSIAILVGAMLALELRVLKTESSSGTGGNWLYAIMMATGCVAMMAAIGGLWSARRAWNSVLFGLWLFGTLAFCLLFNWTVNERVVLPAVFPAALLAVKWLESLDKPKRWLQLCRWSLVPTTAVTLLVAASDYQLASAGRTFARTTVHQHIHNGRRVLFTGHWGLQFYMEHEGAIAIDYRTLRLKDGDLIVYPTTKVHIFPLDATVRSISDSQEEFTNSTGIVTMDFDSGAGFYSSVFGNVPFAHSPRPYIDRFMIDEYVAHPPPQRKANQIIQP